MIYEKNRRSSKLKLRGWTFIRYDTDAGTKREVIVVIIVQPFLNGMIADSEAQDHVANFCH